MLAPRLVLLCVWVIASAANPLAVLSAERIVFQTDLGTLEMALYPKVTHIRTVSCTASRQGNASQIVRGQVIVLSPWQRL